MSRNVEELRCAIAEFDGTCPVAYELGFLHVREDGRWSRIADLAPPAVVDGEEHEEGGASLCRGTCGAVVGAHRGAAGLQGRREGAGPGSLGR